MVLKVYQKLVNLLFDMSNDAFLFKVIGFATLIAVARAGFIGAPAVAAPGPITYAAPAVAKYAAPVAYSAPVAYAAPAVAKVAAPVAYAAPVAKAVLPAEDYDPNPQYSYAYDIQDGLTGDSKNQQESRNGDVVQGSYSLTDPDGTRRTVEYVADPVNGFNAVVHKEPLVAKVAAAPVAYAAPVAKFAAPVAYAAAPAVAKVAYAAPAVAYHH